MLGWMLIFLKYGLIKFGLEVTIFVGRNFFVPFTIVPFKKIKYTKFTIKLWVLKKWDKKYIPFMSHYGNFYCPIVPFLYTKLINF
jgi:hypothetical protein